MSIHDTDLPDWEGVPLVVKPKIAWKMLACSNTRGYELITAGELNSFLDGRSRKITVESIHRYIDRKLAAAGATGSPLCNQRRQRRRGRLRKHAASVTAGAAPGHDDTVRRSATCSAAPTRPTHRVRIPS